MKPYRPSNGTEGEAFTYEYCMHCLHCDPDPMGEKQCDVMRRAFMHDLKEPEYPNEWVYNSENSPICTKWQKWDWGDDGDPDDPNNPKAPEPYNPNQLVFPFIFEEIENKSLK